jgi:hypothetical protein
MSEAQIHGKSIQAIAKDIAEGFFFVNPLILKKFEPEDYKVLHHQLKKLQHEVRTEKFPLHDALAIRSRNTRLQHLHGALIILEHSARERRVVL